MKEILGSFSAGASRASRTLLIIYLILGFFYFIDFAHGDIWGLGAALCMYGAAILTPPLWLILSFRFGRAKAHEATDSRLLFASKFISIFYLIELGMLICMLFANPLSHEFGAMVRTLTVLLSMLGILLPLFWLILEFFYRGRA